MTLNDLLTQPVLHPSLPAIEEALHHYATMDREARQIVTDALRARANPTDIAALITAHQQLLGGYLTMIVAMLQLVNNGTVTFAEQEAGAQ